MGTHLNAWQKWIVGRLKIRITCKQRKKIMEGVFCIEEMLTTKNRKIKTRKEESVERDNKMSNVMITMAIKWKKDKAF